jgi:TM2 domain-containing membrane protein YozV
MPIVVTCPSCGSKLKAPDTAAGKKLKCPKCQAPIAVPGAAADAPQPAAPPVTANDSPFDNLDQPDAGGPLVQSSPPKSAGGKEPPNKMVVGLLAILLGWTGIHKFLLGNTSAGVIMLVSSLLCVGYPVMLVIAIIEGITYLTKSDEDFNRIYVQNKKAWF